MPAITTNNCACMPTIYERDNDRAYTPAIYRPNNRAYTPTIYRPTDRQALCLTTITTAAGTVLLPERIDPLLLLPAVTQLTSSCSTYS